MNEMERKLRNISILVPTGQKRVFRAGRTQQDLILRVSDATQVDLDELRDRLARQKRAADATAIKATESRRMPPSTPKKSRANGSAAAKASDSRAATLAILRQDPEFEARRIAALRSALKARPRRTNPSAAAELARKRAAPGFEAKRIAALKASWTPARRAAAGAQMQARHQDPSFRAAHSAAARANINKLRTPEFEARRIAAMRGAKKRKKA